MGDTQDEARVERAGRKRMPRRPPAIDAQPVATLRWAPSDRADPGLLASVPPTRVHGLPTPAPARPSPVVRASALAAAAALGVMIGIGLRGAGSDGWTTALARLSVVALRLRGLPEFITPDRNGGMAAVFGGVHIALLAAAWGSVVGVMYRLLAARRTPAPYAAAALVGVGAALVSADALLPAPLRLAAGTLGGAEWALMVGVVIAAAWVGAHGAQPRDAAVTHSSQELL